MTLQAKLLRGGSWDLLPKYCRSAYRLRIQPGNADLNVGFRVVCLSDQKKDAAFKMLRGGSWLSLPGYCRSAYRDHNQPGRAYDDVGFRVVCLSDQKKDAAT